MNVETSPLEDLLIEHPSMSVYRATASPVAPETPPPTPDASEDVVVGEDDVLPDLVSSAPDTAATVAPPERSSRRSEDERQATRRRPAIHDGRPAVDRARTEKRIAQLRSASQKVSNFFVFLICTIILRLIGVEGRCGETLCLLLSVGGICS